MKQPKPITAFRIPDAERHHFASSRELVRKLDITQAYALRRLNTGIPCKGWLLFDDNHANTPEAREMIRAVCTNFDEKMEQIEARAKGRENPDALISVRIDSKTVILVKAKNWTPDYAERYRAKMRDAQRQAAKYEPTDFVKQNSHLLDYKKTQTKK